VGGRSQTRKTVNHLGYQSQSILANGHGEADSSTHPMQQTRTQTSPQNMNQRSPFTAKVRTSEGDDPEGHAPKMILELLVRRRPIPMKTRRPSQGMLKTDSTKDAYSTLVPRTTTAFRTCSRQRQPIERGDYVSYDAAIRSRQIDYV